MKIKSVFSKAFVKYGKVLEGYEVSDLLKKLEETTPCPTDATVYKPGEPALEKLAVMQEFSDGAYGGMPIQIGYCNGYNTKLNCLEYHRGMELNIPTTDIILLVANVADIENGKLSTKKVEAFHVPAGTVVQVYGTTLHYAPCCDVKADGKVSDGFRVAIVLPKDTNTAKPEIKVRDFEDNLLWARNKWLLAHPSSSEASQGAYVGLTGKNIDLKIK